MSSNSYFPFEVNVWKYLEMFSKGETRNIMYTGDGNDKEKTWTSVWVLKICGGCCGHRFRLA